jgi:crossover junction endodeoxyribonuclease RuvC
MSKINFCYFIGVDPGKEGVIAVIDQHNSYSLYNFQDCFTKKKIDFIKYKNFSENFTSKIEPIKEVCFACIENVHSMPKQGVKSTFKFGFYHGLIVSIIVKNIINTDFIEPHYWKGRYNLTSNKQRSIQLAQRLFNIKQKITDGQAEALLLAYFAKEEQVYRYIHQKKGVKNVKD